MTKRKAIKKLGTRRTVLEKAYPDEEIPSNPVTDPCDIQTSRNIISDDNSFNFSSEQTRRLYIHCREKWGSMGKAQMPSTGPTSNESKTPSTQNTGSANSRWETDPFSSAKTPSKQCSNSSKKKNKNGKKRKLEQWLHIKHLGPESNHSNFPFYGSGHLVIWFDEQFRP